MLAPTRKDVENLMYLRDVIIPFVRAREKEGLVDFNSYSNTKGHLWWCKTTHCLAGWITNHKPFREKFGLIESEGQNINRLFEVLGIKDADTWHSIFGQNPAGDLEARAEACTALINKKLSQS